MAKKKKDQLPVFVVVEMPEWKDKVLQFVLKLLFVNNFELLNLDSFYNFNVLIKSYIFF